MDSSDQHRAVLPPLKVFDFKREEQDYQSRNTNMTPVSMPSSSAPSPSYSQYPNGPPPPYSHPAPQHFLNSPVQHAAPRSPPELRRSSRDDEGDKQQAKQSLPSIHEALGVEQPRSYPLQQPPYSAAPQPSYQAPATPSSPPAPRRSFGMEPPPPPATTQPAHPASSYAAPRRSSGPYCAEISPRTAQDHFERTRSVYGGAPPPPVLPSRKEYSPVHPPASYPPQSYPAVDPSPAIERPNPPSSSMPPPPAPPFSYGYTGFQPRPAYAAPFAAPSSGSVYQTSITQPPLTHPPPVRPGAMDADRAVYGESVKRHLDMYDFEASLNEVCESSGYVHDSSRQIGARMHQTQRSGPVPGTLPSVGEVDDLILRARATVEYLGRMRETVIAQQTAFFQQAQEQQYKAQDDVKRDSVHDESKAGGFAGPEAKKRRGRAAPPGRCHSCQRAETPEWRRGPDGARTLCNACGLHYAKLTRKQGAQKAAIGSSNLRPKAGSSELPELQN